MPDLAESPACERSPRWRCERTRIAPAALAVACTLLLQCADCRRSAGGPCGSSADCITGEACFEKLCRPQCSGPDACDVDQSCFDNVCLTVNAPCAVADDCFAIERCVAGTCRRLCSIDVACPNGLVCQQGGFCLISADAAHPESGTDGVASLDSGIRDSALPEAAGEGPVTDGAGGEAGLLDGRTDTSQLVRHTLMYDNFDDVSIDDRWSVLGDGCSTDAIGEIHRGTSLNVCGDLTAYAYRPYAGSRCMIWKTPFNSTGSSDVHLTYSVYSTSSSSIQVFVRRGGNWVEVASHGASADWVEHDLTINQAFTNLRFDLNSPEGLEARLDCISVTGWQ